MVLPFGFKFIPSDEELVCYYLQRKIRGLPIPPFTVQDHDETFLDPRAIDWNQPSYARDHERYYFLRRVQSGDKKRVKRIGYDQNGYWKLSQSFKKVYDRRNRVVGFISHLNYFTYKDDLKIWKEAIKTRWIMHEYKLATQETCQEWVVCRIIRETTTQRQHRKQKQEEDSDTFDFLETTLMSPNHRDAQQDNDHTYFIDALEIARSNLPPHEH